MLYSWDCLNKICSIKNNRLSVQIEFIKLSGKKEKTVVSWIKSGLVNGASFTDGVYIISDLARPPYMRASSKNSAAIRKGIVVGCKRRLSVNAKVFRIPEEEFQVYVNQLIIEKLVEKRSIDGTDYYYSTQKADGISEKKAYRIIKGLTEAAVGAAAGVATEKMMGQ